MGDNSNPKRKQKSLSYLCERFCSEYKKTTADILIDDASDKLGVQRRRMYEILNIMKSIGLVSRVKTCIYRWEGYDSMVSHLRYLQKTGMRKEYSMPPEVYGKKKAVATCLSERFIQIFLCNEFPQPIVLEDIIGVFKQYFGEANHSISRGRRLYDIANVFCTLGLIQQSFAMDSMSKRRKKLYTWCGPKLEARREPYGEPLPRVACGSSNEVESSAKRQKVGKGIVDNRMPLRTLQSSLFKGESSYVKPPRASSRVVGCGKPERNMWGDHDYVEDDGRNVYDMHNHRILENYNTKVDSTIALKAEVYRLSHALEMSVERETFLLSKLQSQEREKSSIVINSPAANVVLTPFDMRSRMNGTRNGPALPNLDMEQEQTDNNSHNNTPSSYLLRAAATSLLSLTPNKIDDDSLRQVSQAAHLPNLNSPLPNNPTMTRPRRDLEGNMQIIRENSKQFESPSQTQYIFDTLSPLANVRVWEEF